MSPEKIIENARKIESYQKALAWLEKFGGQQDASHFSFTCGEGYQEDGQREAQAMIERRAELRISEMVAASIENCRNTIELCREAISEEVQP